MKRATALLFLSATAAAVCVDGKVPLKKEYSNSLYVATVRVVSNTPVPDSNDGWFYAGTNYRLKRLESLKGEAPEAFTVFNENTTGRFDMDANTTYLVFVYREHGRLRIDNCGNSTRLDSASETLNTIRALSKKQD